MWNKISKMFYSIVDSKLKEGKSIKTAKDEKKCWNSWKTKKTATNEGRYKEINKIINKKIIKAKNQKHDTFNTHKMKTVTEGKSSRSNNSILDKHSNMLREIRRILEKWREYVGK